MQRLTKAVPSALSLLQSASERGANLGNMTHQLLTLLDVTPAAELEAAVAQARATPYVGAVRQLLELQRAEQGRPPVAIHFVGRADDLSPLLDVALKHRWIERIEKPSVPPAAFTEEDEHPF
jgi:hypothetical protein